MVRIFAVVAMLVVAARAIRKNVVTHVVSHEEHVVSHEEDEEHVVSHEETQIGGLTLATAIGAAPHDPHYAMRSAEIPLQTLFDTIRQRFGAALTEHARVSNPGQHYAFVGAGPVGLWTALQLKLRVPRSNVTIYENREGYTRTHMLRLEWKVFQEGFGGMKEFEDNLLPRFNKVLCSDHSNCSMGAARLSIVCKDLEGILEDYAVHLGIQIVRFKADSRDGILEQATPTTGYPPALVVGADGRHSTTRDKVLPDRAIAGEQMDVTKVFQYNVFLKFFLRDPPAKGALKSRCFGALTRMHKHNCVCIFGQPGSIEEDGRTFQQVPVTVQIPVAEIEAHMLRTNCKDREKGTPPCTVFNKTGKDSRVPDSVLNDVNMAFDRVASSEEEARRLKFGTEISLVVVDAYISKDVAKIVVVKHKGDDWLIPFALVGDAAFGVPYFRGLWNGLYTGISLAELIAATLAPAGDILDGLLALLKVEIGSWSDKNLAVPSEPPARVTEIREAISQLRHVSCSHFVYAYRSTVQTRFAAAEAWASRKAFSYTSQNAVGKTLKNLFIPGHARRDDAAEMERAWLKFQAMNGSDVAAAIGQQPAPVASQWPNEQPVAYGSGSNRRPSRHELDDILGY